MNASHNIVASEAFRAERFGARLAPYRPASRIEADPKTADRIMLVLAVAGVVGGLVAACSGALS